MLARSPLHRCRSRGRQAAALPPWLRRSGSPAAALRTPATAAASSAMALPRAARRLLVLEPVVRCDSQGAAPVVRRKETGSVTLCRKQMGGRRGSNARGHDASRATYTDVAPESVGGCSRLSAAAAAAAATAPPSSAGEPAIGGVTTRGARRVDASCCLDTGLRGVAAAAAAAAGWRPRLLAAAAAAGAAPAPTEAAAP